MWLPDCLHCSADQTKKIRATTTTTKLLMNQNWGWAATESAADDNLMNFQATKHQAIRKKKETLCFIMDQKLKTLNSGHTQNKW
jgi:hypothetical protein